MKYKLTNKYITLDNGIIVYQIKALKDFSNIKKGSLGGFVESEDNLSQEGDCWIYDKAKVYSNAVVFGNVQVSDDAQVFGDAQVYDDVWVFGNAEVSGNAKVYGNAKIYGNAKVHGNARVYDDAKVSFNSKVSNNAQVYGAAQVYGFAWIFGNAKVFDNAWIFGDAQIYGEARVYGDAQVFGGAWPVSPMYLCLSKHFITTSSYTHIKIGCLIHTIEEWYNKGREIGKENEYSDYEIELYFEAIRLAEINIELAKNGSKNG